MKLVAFNKDQKFQNPFKNYIKSWKNQPSKPNEDYYKMYSKFLDNYEESIDKNLKLSDNNRLKNNEPFVKFYWLCNSSDIIVGTIRYRDNIPPFYGNLGYEISPSHRNKGLGKLMLSLLSKELKLLGIRNIYATVSKDNEFSIKLLKSEGAVRSGTVTSEDGKLTLLKFKLEI